MAADLTPQDAADFPALPGVPAAERAKLRARFAPFEDSYLARTAAPTVARDEILAAVRAHGGDVANTPHQRGPFKWYEGSVLVTESDDTWSLHARSVEALVPWIRAFGERRPPKPIWFPVHSAVRAEGAPPDGPGLVIPDRDPGAEGRLILREGGAVIRYRLPGGAMSIALGKRAVAGLYDPWESSFRDVPAAPAFVIVGDDGRPGFLAWLDAQGAPQRLVEAVTEALGVAHGVRRFNRTAVCGPVVCHAMFSSGAPGADAFDSPLLRAGDPALAPGDPARILVGYWDIGAADAFVYLGEDRRIHRYSFDHEAWVVTASSYATYVERTLRWDATVQAPLWSDLPITEICRRLALVIDPVGTDDLATLAVSADTMAFQRPGARAQLKCSTPEAEERARRLLGA